MLIVKLFMLLLTFFLGFAFIPKFAFSEVDKLFRYHKYQSQPFKTRYWKVIRVYLSLGVVLFIVFTILLSLTMERYVSSADATIAIPTGTGQILLLIFTFSFLLVIALRISTLLHKSKIVCWFLNDNKQKTVLHRSEKFNYTGLREETKSFLFSLVISALLSIAMFTAFTILFNEQATWILPQTRLTMKALSRFLWNVFLFASTILIATGIGEGILQWIGVRPALMDKEPAEE